MIHSSPPRPSHNDPLDGRHDAPPLNDGEERALEAIRRQLEIDFPVDAQEAATRHPQPRRAKLDATSWPWPASRRMRVWTVVGVLSLLVCAVAGGAGVRLATQYDKAVESPLAQGVGDAAGVASRDHPRPAPPDRDVVGPRDATPPGIVGPRDATAPREIVGPREATPPRATVRPAGGRRAAAVTARAGAPRDPPPAAAPDARIVGGTGVRRAGRPPLASRGACGSERARCAERSDGVLSGGALLQVSRRGLARRRAPRRPVVRHPAGPGAALGSHSARCIGGRGRPAAGLGSRHLALSAASAPSVAAPDGGPAHSQHVDEGVEAAAERDRRSGHVGPANRHFDDREPEPSRDEQALDVEPESVEPLAREDLARRLRREQLEPALGVPEREPGEEPRHAVEGLAGKLSAAPAGPGR